MNVYMNISYQNYIFSQNHTAETTQIEYPFGRKFHWIASPAYDFEMLNVNGLLCASEIQLKFIFLQNIPLLFHIIKYQSPKV